MENYIVINGKKSELTEEQLKLLGIEIKKENPYQCEADGYYIDNFGKVINCYTDSFQEKSRKHYLLFKTEEFAKQTMFRELLERKLRAFSYENGLTDDLSMSSKSKWVVYYDASIKKFDVDIWQDHCFGMPVFLKESTANRAIKEIVEPFMEEHKDFVWGM